MLSPFAHNFPTSSTTTTTTHQRQKPQRFADGREVRCTLSFQIQTKQNLLNTSKHGGSKNKNGAHNAMKGSTKYRTNGWGSHKRARARLGWSKHVETISLTTVPYFHNMVTTMFHLAMVVLSYEHPALQEPFWQCLLVVRGGWSEVTLWAAFDSQTTKVSDAHCFDCDH